MNTPRNYKVGERITLTDENIKTMQASNRSCVTPNYPSGQFIQSIARFVGVVGKVKHRHMPGYEMTIEFPDSDAPGRLGWRFHVKDNWVTLVDPDIVISVHGRAASGKSAVIQIIKEALDNVGLTGAVEFSLDGQPTPRDAETLQECIKVLSGRKLEIQIHEQQAARPQMRPWGL